MPFLQGSALLAMPSGERLQVSEQQSARERQAISKGGEHPQLVANLPEGDHGRSRDQAAKAVGVSGRSVEHAATTSKLRREKNPVWIGRYREDVIANRSRGVKCTVSDQRHGRPVQERK